MRLLQKSKVRFLQKSKEAARKLDSGEWDEVVYQRHILPLLAFTRHAETVGFQDEKAAGLVGK